MSSSSFLSARNFTVSALAVCFFLSGTRDAFAGQLAINEHDYLEMQGLNVMLAHDYYPEGHQGGVSIIQNGLRVATNGDLRLDRTPGQWSPMPTQIGERTINEETQSISARFQYPDEKRNRKGFNPIVYPDLEFSYQIEIQPENGNSFLITVNLDETLPPEWDGEVSFMLEFFPGFLFGKSYSMDGKQAGIFPRQANGPGEIAANGDYNIAALATGKRLTVAPEVAAQRLVVESLAGGEIELVDGRGMHTNGWFIARSYLERGATSKALQWRISPSVIEDWISKPAIQISQVGYHTQQPKYAIIELDKNDTQRRPIALQRIKEDGSLDTVLQSNDVEWGSFLRFNYLKLDFSNIVDPGMYLIRYGDQQSEPFRIGDDTFSRHVWQTTLEQFLPIQMCHMRVNDRYQVWHGVCHLDDARMAPLDHNHFDGYIQGSDTMSKYKPGDIVPGLNRGGWHDAGDHDLRVESQGSTMYGLALAYEAFGEDYDNTTIDQDNRVVEIHRPDGKADILQQIEHGALTVVGGYEALGRLYRGIIAPTLRQYTLLGDPSNQTDNAFFDPELDAIDSVAIGQGTVGSPDDRWVFTQKRPKREMRAAAGLAASSRVLRGFNDAMADKCLRIAEELWVSIEVEKPELKVILAVELLLATEKSEYKEFLESNSDGIADNFELVGWAIGRALPLIENGEFHSRMRSAAEAYAEDVKEQESATPYGVPYEPDIWGAGWGIQRFGAGQYFLHKAYPEIFSADLMFNALSFVLGCHPGSNTASFVSGVGSKSVTVGYGFNRADWSYIPGGSISGTALIRPDYPELLEWPFLWQQTEYVLGGGTTHYLFLALAADKLLGGE